MATKPHNLTGKELYQLALKGERVSILWMDFSNTVAERSYATLEAYELEYDGGFSMRYHMGQFHVDLWVETTDEPFEAEAEDLTIVFREIKKRKKK